MFQQTELMTLPPKTLLKRLPNPYMRLTSDIAFGYRSCPAASYISAGVWEFVMPKKTPCRIQDPSMAL